MTDGFQRRSISLPVKLVLAGAAAAAMAYAVRQRRRMDFEGKIVVIAGASRGLGLELARSFAKEGACVVLLAAIGRNSLRSRQSLSLLESRSRCWDAILPCKTKSV